MKRSPNLLVCDVKLEVQLPHISSCIENAQVTSLHCSAIYCLLSRGLKLYVCCASLGIHNLFYFLLDGYHITERSQNVTTENIQHDFSTCRVAANFRRNVQVITFIDECVSVLFHQQVLQYPTFCHEAEQIVIAPKEDMEPHLHDICIQQQYLKCFETSLLDIPAQPKQTVE